MQVVNEITLESYVKDIQQSIEKITLLHIEFWAQLKEDTPDLLKLNDIGSKLNTLISSLQAAWKKMVRMNMDIPPNLMRTYTKFLFDVANDRDATKEVITLLSNLLNHNTQRGRSCNNLNEF